MKIIIQCCASKYENYWYYKGQKIMFVANPDMCESKASVKYFTTGQRIESNGLTWQRQLEQYNKYEGNPDRLKKAGELYKPNIYLELVEHFGPENVFILSAGWGLVRADFYLPAYDITFQQSADKCKKRIYEEKGDKFSDFNHLSCSNDEAIYFFGGLQYLDMYYDYTRNLSCQKIIYYISETLDEDNRRERGYHYIKYKTPRKQNWHYSCAKDFIAGKIEKKINICKRLHDIINNCEKHSFPFDPSIIPKNGIYILFERGERGHGNDRLVRIGTHTGDDQLPSRLTQHFINENKDRSIFRKNIGRSFLNKETSSFLEQWEWDLTTREAKEKYNDLLDIDKQYHVEKQVSKYIQKSFSFVVIEIRDKEMRLNYESKLISTISLCNDCVPSDNWLGTYSPKPKIQDSGMWQEQELYKTPLTLHELDELLLLIPPKTTTKQNQQYKRTNNHTEKGQNRKKRD